MIRMLYHYQYTTRTLYLQHARNNENGFKKSIDRRGSFRSYLTGKVWGEITIKPYQPHQIIAGERKIAGSGPAVLLRAWSWQIVSDERACAAASHQNDDLRWQSRKECFGSQARLKFTSCIRCPLPMLVPSGILMLFFATLIQHNGWHILYYLIVSLYARWDFGNI